MFGTDTHTSKPEEPCEPRPIRTTSIDQVLNRTDFPQPGSQEAYHKSYFWWMNPENTITLEDIAELYQYQYGENFAYHTPSEK